MAIVKYNPLRELRSMQDQMDRLLNLSWGNAAEFTGEDIKEGVWQPAVDIYETADSIVIKAELPDLDQKDIDVRIEDNLLTIKGERKHETDVKKENYHRIERYFGTFQRSFKLPATVAQERVSASCERGVLTITLPKKEEVKPKQIQVEVK
ncbi:Hsp20/alpha crystallin family protein [Trichlorobacter ammonificans]|uniref:Heat shock protein Hsp20 n=1 Tax=Trichlorobacter ammonificans TaxID=2916410 RepID=A0ABM9D9J1_9BACT|nr:Hsp20/alpha crystallin family protein [Trichlorobacter ammonificans]CAH2031900.1 Heat shock protein Hsp20 [Trichlorobacter ammonificans]